MFILAVVRPPWLECASSMMMANFRPRCSSPISSRMKGNFWTVVMMIFLPASRNLRRSPESSAWPTVAETCANCLMVSRICLSRTRRSVMTITESKTALPSCSSPMSWCASQAMELLLPLPAECSMRYRRPAARARRRPAACGRRPAGGSAGTPAGASSAPCRPSPRRPGRSSPGCPSAPPGSGFASRGNRFSGRRGSAGCRRRRS